jgi:hypothetical protein
VPKNFGDNVSVYPKGRTLPDSFLHKDWSRDPMASQLPTCLTNFGEGCDAFFLALTADGREQIVILGADRNGAVTGPDGVFAQDGKGDWHMVGVPEDRWLCSSVRTALRRGELRIVPADPVERDVEVRGLRLKVNPSETPCPP